MKMPIAEVADKATILLLKINHGMPTEENLTEYQDEIKDVDCTDLTAINTKMWEIENLISRELMTSKNIEQVGHYYLHLRDLTKQRVAAKNKIAAEHGGPMERKNY